MRIPFFFYLSLVISPSFAMPIVQSPILFADDFITPKSDNTTAKKLEATTAEQPMLIPSEASFFSSTPSETAELEQKNAEPQIAASQYDQLIPIITLTNMHQTYTKTPH